MELKQKIEIELKRMIWIISTCIDKQWLHLKKGQAKKESDHIKTQIKTCEKTWWKSWTQFWNSCNLLCTVVFDIGKSQMTTICWIQGLNFEQSQCHSYSLLTAHLNPLLSK